MKTVNFKKEGNRYVSDPILIESDSVVVRVAFDKGGQCDIERSIDGSEPYVFAATFSDVMSINKAEEKTIVGLKQGTYIRLSFINRSVPSKISILQ